jgi:hypothetical protein
MTPSKWVEATKLYNSEAVKLDQLRGSNQSHSYIAKNPRALMLQLGMVEATISDRIITGNYKCEQSRGGLCCVSHTFPTAMKGTEAFWREHCHVVPLMREDQLDRKVCLYLILSRPSIDIIYCYCSLESRLRALVARKSCIRARPAHLRTTREVVVRTA